MTPPEAWDKRPKVVRQTVHPFASIPRIPRAPAVPSGVAPDIEARDRDTDIAELSPSGEHEVHDTDDETPPDGPFAVRQVLKQLKKFEDGFRRMEAHCEVAANSALATAQDVKHLRREFQELKKEHGDRLVRLELDRLWVPRAVSTAAILISIATALFVLIKLR
jgi:hypothetical protein